MVEGVRLEDGPAKALSAEVHEKAETNTWIKIVVGEGRFHLVKRLCESVGLPVLRLYRPEFGGITVARLRPGHWRDLTHEEVQVMRAAVGMSGGEAGRTALAHDLPKAGRRHGHGPPPQAAVHAGTRRPGHAGDQRAFEENNPPAPGRPGKPARKDPRVRPERRPERPARVGRDERTVRPGRDSRPEPSAAVERVDPGARKARPSRGSRQERASRSGQPPRASAPRGGRPGGRGK
jgi:23S rRNA pseudouridine2605 synthase